MAWERETTESSEIELARIKSDIQDLQALTYISEAFPMVQFKFCVHLSKVNSYCKQTAVSDDNFHFIHFAVGSKTSQC